MLKPIRDIINNCGKTDSPIENLLYLEFQKYGLEPKIQYQIGVFYVDLAFPEIKLAIEADGREFHTSKLHIEQDKYRQKRIESQGWKFERFTGSFIHKQGDVAAAKIVLKYFPETLNEENKLIASGRIVSYLCKNDLKLASLMTDVYLNGYVQIENHEEVNPDELLKKNY